MGETLDLLSWTPPIARNSDCETSHAAAAMASMRASEDRLLVLRLLADGPKTDFEIADITGRQQTSLGKRRGDCVDYGLVEVAKDGDEILKRPAPSGSMARVWCITGAGLRFLEQNRRAA